MMRQTFLLRSWCHAGISKYFSFFILWPRFSFILVRYPLIRTQSSEHQHTTCCSSKGQQLGEPGVVANMSQCPCSLTEVESFDWERWFPFFMIVRPEPLTYLRSVEKRSRLPSAKAGGWWMLRLIYRWEWQDLDVLEPNSLLIVKRWADGRKWTHSLRPVGRALGDGE